MRKSHKTWTIWSEGNEVRGDEVVNAGVKRTKREDRAGKKSGN
jgi:hypothetical protein